MINPKNRIELIEQIRESPELQQFWDEKKKKFKNEERKKDLASYFNDSVAKEKLEKFFKLWKKQKIPDEKWSAFLRLALYNYDKMEFMYNQTNYLLIKHNISDKDYFRIKLHNSFCVLPDQVYELIMFENLCNKFFKIFKLIEHKYSFDNQSREHVSKKIHGKTDWMKTLKESKYSTPQYFQISSNVKEFGLPENILLGFTIYKIFEIVKKYDSTDKDKKLSKKEHKIIRNIEIKIKKCMDNFPHRRVLEHGKTLSNHNIKSFLIKDVLEKCKNQKNSFQNNAYKLFIDWFDDFTEIHNKISQKRAQSSYMNEATKDFDTMFEMWILMELYDEAMWRYGISKNSQMQSPYEKEFEFLINGNRCVLEYDHKKEVSTSSDNWATESRPDYLIKCNGTPIAVFDAKNTIAARGEPNHKVLGYMMNFECDLGGAIYSNVKSTAKSERVNESKEKKFCNYELDLTNRENHKEIVEKIFSDIEEKLILKDSSYGR